MKKAETGMREHERSAMSGAPVAIDPVCGMEVKKKESPAMFLYLGQTLYFCSQACKRLFHGNPEKYMKSMGK